MFLSHFRALDNRKQLRDALSQLPAPRNDYEIVAPEEDFSELPDEMQTSEWVEDASEVKFYYAIAVLMLAL